MTTSGRDRDPAFRRKNTTSKPATTPIKRPVKETSKAEETTKPITPTPAPIKPQNTPDDSLTSPVVEPRTKVQPALVYEEDSKPQKEKVVVPPVTTKNVIKTETPKKSASGTGNPPPPSKNPPSNGSSDKGSGRRKVLGVIMAIVFIVGMGLIGYFMVNNILEKERNKSNTEVSESSSEENNEEGTAHAGDVDMENSEESSTEEGGSEADDGEMRETTLNDENSLENEMNETSNEESSGENSNLSQEENTEEQEKQALSKVIRKKGDFEIPCWIVAFSANNKKPLANMNYSALEALGFDAGIYWIPKYFPDGKSMYKVYVGPYKTPGEAEAILPQIKNLQPDAYIMKIDE